MTTDCTVKTPSKPNREKMTPLAHAVRFAIRCGIESVDDLANELECTRSAIYRALKQLPDADRTVTKSDPAVKSDRTELTERSQSDRVVTKSDCTVTPSRTRARAQNEYPSDILSNEEVVVAREVEGLNGSTHRLCKQLATWIAGPIGFPDLEAARAMIEGAVDVYGPDKVRTGMFELQTRIETGDRPRDIGKAFASFVKYANPAKENQSPQSWEEKNRQEAAEWLAQHGVKL